MQKKELLERLKERGVIRRLPDPTGWVLVPTMRDVALAVNDSIHEEEKGVTSGLQVRDLLRKRGFYAVEHEVSAILHTLVGQGVLYGKDDQLAEPPHWWFWPGYNWNNFMRSTTLAF